MDHKVRQRKTILPERLAQKTNDHELTMYVQQDSIGEQPNWNVDTQDSVVVAENLW